MKINAKWVIGSIARLVLMGPIMVIHHVCENVLRWLDRRLPGG